MRIHASCVARRGRAVLLRGPSGSGKSDLALRFLDAYPDAWLIADDQVELSARDGRLFAAASRVLRGLIEVRGLGLARRPVPADAGAWPIRLCVDLGDTAAPPRIAEPRTETLSGIDLPVLPMAAFEMSAPAKLALALETIAVSGFPGEDGLLS